MKTCSLTAACQLAPDACQPAKELQYYLGDADVRKLDKTLKHRTALSSLPCSKVCIYSVDLDTTIRNTNRSLEQTIPFCYMACWGKQPDSNKIALKAYFHHRPWFLTILKVTWKPVQPGYCLRVAETKCPELSGTLVYRGNNCYTEIKQTWIIDSPKPIRSEYSFYPRYNA